MSVELVYPHIEKPPGEPARFQSCPRFHVSHLIAVHLAYAWPAEELQRQYPHFTAAEIHSAMAYYFDHKEEIDREVRDDLARFDKEWAENRDPAFVMKLRARKAS